MYDQGVNKELIASQGPRRFHSSEVGLLFRGGGAGQRTIERGFCCSSGLS